MSSLERENGKRWENYIRKECAELKRLQRAWVDKNWEAPAVPGQHIKREASKPDFSGFLMVTGMHVVFEAKATLSKTSLPFSSIAKHQWEHLNKAYFSDAVSFVYVLDGADRKWVFPWGAILGAAKTRKSMPLVDGSPYQKQPGETWLGALARIEFSEFL